VNITERDRLAAALIALRPDWGQGAVDKTKRVRTWLSENAMGWSYRDAVVRMTVCAIEPSTVTPARALQDGPWTMIARTLTAGGTNQPLTTEQRGGDCATCGVARARHARSSVLILVGMDGRPVPEHDWQPAAQVTPASPDTIRAARPEFHTTGDPA